MTKTEQTSKGKTKSPRSRKCLTCRKWFSPLEQGITTCSTECAIMHGKTNLTKQKTKEHRKVKQDFNKQDKSKLMKDCQKIANKIGKLHAYISGATTCVTCDVLLSTQMQVDGGHGFPTSTYSGIRFYTLQIRPQCVKCNRYNSGMRSEFEVALTHLYGLEKVEWMASFKGEVHKYTVPYLTKYKTTMSKRLRELEFRHTNKR